jgi:hypothetical protein
MKAKKKSSNKKRSKTCKTKKQLHHPFIGQGNLYIPTNETLRHEPQGES